MALGYIRQAAGNIQPNLDINAEDFNLEFNDLQAAFDITLGHDHSGSSAGTGAKIVLSTSVTGILPVANGGTGVITSTGTGSTVLNASPALISPTITGGLTVSTGGLIVAGGGESVTGNLSSTGTLTSASTLTVNAGGANITGNSVITGTVQSTGALTVSAGGATITGNSTVTGTLNATAGLQDNGNRAISKSNLFSVLNNGGISNPSTITSATAVMAGINQTIATTTTGRLLITICGNATTTAGTTSTPLIWVYAGTGAAPTNGAAATGTRYSNGIQIPIPVLQAFSISVIAVLSTGVTYWLDLGLQSDGTHSFTVSDLTLCATEI